MPKVVILTFISQNSEHRHMDMEELRNLLNCRVRLAFRDGEVVDALLLGVDWERNRDLTYEIIRVEKSGSPVPKGTALGATVIASLNDLEGFERLL